MSGCFLGDQTRPAKPRRSGLTAIIDPGLPVDAFADIIQSHQTWIDAVKFGWGSALVTARVGEKIAVLKRHSIPFWFGGTLFERAYAEGRVEEFIEFVGHHGAPYVEISDGTISLPSPEKLRLIRRLSDEFLVLSEIGKKDSDIEPDADAWMHAIWSELEAGARWVILEGRESGNAGLYHPTGAVRTALMDTILRTSLKLDDIFFEAPRKEHQAHFIRTLGAGVNLSNIAAADVIGLETLRRGLRGDTFHDLPARFAVELLPAE
jgi:phosphosulfolactate synthase